MSTPKLITIVILLFLAILCLAVASCGTTKKNISSLDRKSDSTVTKKVDSGAVKTTNTNTSDYEKYFRAWYGPTTGSTAPVGQPAPIFIPGTNTVTHNNTTLQPYYIEAGERLRTDNSTQYDSSWLAKADSLQAIIDEQRKNKDVVKTGPTFFQSLKGLILIFFAGAAVALFLRWYLVKRFTLTFKIAKRVT